MHDIICPRCGRKFIARDVVYDISEYIYPLITEDNIRNNFQRNFIFKFLVDEQFIIENSEDVERETYDGVKISLSTNGIPNSEDNFYEFSVTSPIILKYIMNKIGFESKKQRICEVVSDILDGAIDEDDSFAVFSSFIGIVNGVLSTPANSRTAKDKFNSIRKNPVTISFVQEIFAKCFAKNTRFDFENEGKQVVSMLNYLTTIADGNSAIPLSIKLSCSEEGVPDDLYIKTDRGMAQVKKSCRHCGIRFPREYGHHKMIPIVFFGSHNSGKTTYLCSLNRAIMNKPFFSFQNITFTSLNTDDNVITQMLEYYNAGKACPKTEVKLEEVPYTSILVTKKGTREDPSSAKSAIYVFVDGPGEIMVKENGELNDYNLTTSLALFSARHMFCFVTPEQVVQPGNDNDDDDYEENVAYDPNTIYTCLRNYVDAITGKPNHRFSTIVTIINKFDRYNLEGNKELAAEPFSEALSTINTEVYDKMIQSRIYNRQSGEWDDTVWEYFKQLMEDFLLGTNAQDIFQSISDDYEAYAPAYVPVAPMGFTAQSDSLDDGEEKKNPQPIMVAIPLLYVLYRDGMLKNMPEKKN